MTTSIQEAYAHKLVAALNENGFIASFDGDDQEYVPTINYRKNGIHGKSILVNELIKKEWADSVVIEEKEDSITEDIKYCESEIKYAISQGAKSTEGMTEEDILNSLYE